MSWAIVIVVICLLLIQSQLLGKVQNVVQQLKTENESLKAELEELKSRVDELDGYITDDEPEIIED